MNWKEVLMRFERNKQWDYAIEFMQDIITQNPDNLDAYLSMNYLLMNLLVEERYDIKSRDYYADLLKKYFDESYAKFSQNPEYLFYIGTIAVMSEWYFDLELEEVEDILQKAIELDPNNVLYHWNLDEKNPKNKDKIMNCVQLIKYENSSIKKILDSKGTLGEYIWHMMVYWANKMVK